MIKNVPLILQMENAECGAAALAMVMRYFGKNNLSLEQLRLDCHVSRDGVTARGIKDAAQKYGLKCTIFKAEPKALKKISLPVIIHWNMNHFVVLTRISGNNYYINDPAYGKKRIVYDEFNTSFTGIIMSFEKTKAFKADFKKQKNNFTLNKVKPFFWGLFLISFFSAIVTLMNLILPYFNSSYIDNILIEANTSSFKTFVFAFTLIVFFRFFAMVIYEKISFETEKNMNINLSVGFMQKIFELPITFFMQRTPGELANRQLGNFETAQLVCNSLSSVFCQLVLIVIYGFIVFKYNILIGLVGIAAVLLNVIISFFASKNMGNVSASEKKNRGLYYGAIASVIDMIDTIKSCACEDALFQRLMGTAAITIQPRITREKLKLYSSALFETVNFSVSVSIIIIGISLVINNDITVGKTVGFLGVFSAFLVPIGNFIKSVSSIYDFKSIAERTNDTMKYRSENIFLPKNKNSDKIMGNDIDVQNVSFAYGGSTKNAISNISFKIKTGESIAFTGASGSGKSTVAKLISGLYTETEGYIYYGNALKKDIHKKDFYSKIAIVSQNIKIYAGTVLENITMWDKSIEYEDVVKACRTACIHDDIISRTNAYYEKITEDGTNFSSGQKQRFEIARALVRKPEILILDEATSALDANTEKTVMNNISSLGITLIIIAHRLNTVRNCNNIIVFQNGEIIQQGTHEELLKQNGLYTQLVSEE